MHLHVRLGIVSVLAWEGVYGRIDKLSTGGARLLYISRDADALEKVQKLALKFVKGLRHVPFPGFVLIPPKQNGTMVKD